MTNSDRWWRRGISCARRARSSRPRPWQTASRTEGHARITPPRFYSPQCSDLNQRCVPRHEPPEYSRWRSPPWVTGTRRSSGCRPRSKLRDSPAPDVVSARNQKQCSTGAARGPTPAEHPPRSLSPPTDHPSCDRSRIGTTDSSLQNDASSEGRTFSTTRPQSPPKEWSSMRCGYLTPRRWRSRRYPSRPGWFVSPGSGHRP